jgi:hypothetical protein
LVYYVGQSKVGLKRARVHLTPHALASDKDTPKTRWIKELVAAGVDPVPIVLETMPDSALLVEREKFWILHWRVANPKLTNVSSYDRTRSLRGRVPSEQHRERLRVSATARGATPEFRAKLSAARKGMKFSDEARKNMSIGQRKRFESLIERTKLDAARRLVSHHPMDDSSRLKLARARGARPFIDQAGNRYESVRATARLLGLGSSLISSVLKGKQLSTGGYVFRYVEEPLIQTDVVITPMATDG